MSIRKRTRIRLLQRQSRRVADSVITIDAAAWAEMEHARRRLEVLRARLARLDDLGRNWRQDTPNERG